MAGRVVEISTLANPVQFRVFDSAGEDGVFVNVEFYREGPSGTRTDAETIQAAVDDGLPLGFPERTYEIGTGETIINRNTCHAMLFAGTTWKIADGAIVNTDANKTNFTPFMQHRGVVGLQMFGTLTVDGNADQQTYPATAADFGRGTAAIGSAGRRFNAVVEFVAGDDNTTPTSDVFICGQFEVKDGYLNGLAFCQTERVEIIGIYTHDNAVNGISAEGVTSFLVNGSRHYRDGVSASYPSTTSEGDRAGIQLREIPASYTSAQLLMPFIPAAGSDNFVNVDVSIVNGSAEECQVEGFFLRMCFPGRIADCFSKNVGYTRSPSTTFRAAHFWCEGGWYQMNNLCGLQQTDNDALGYQIPDGIVCQTFDGDGSGSSGGAPIEFGGVYRSVVNGLRIECGYDSAGNPQQNYARGARIYSECTANNLYIEGVTVSFVRLENDTNFNLLPPRNITIRDAKFENAVTCDFPIKINRFGGPSVTGDAHGFVFDNIQISDLATSSTGSDDHAIIDFDNTMSGYELELTATNLNFDCVNADAAPVSDQTGNYNGVRLRCPAGSKIKVHFSNINNAFTPLRVSGGDNGGGFESLELYGAMDTCHRIWLIDAAAWTANAGNFKFDVNAVGITSQLFFVTGFVSSGFKIRAMDANYRVSGDATCRTFPSGAAGTSGNITTTANSFFSECLWYKWGPNDDNYGSGAPTTNIYDMRRTFTAAGLAAATPYYAGELVVDTDNTQNYMGLNKNTAGTWSLLSSP